LRNSVRTLNLDEFKMIPVEFAEPKPVLNAYVGLKSPMKTPFN
jgi:hypothetical protein